MKKVMLFTIALLFSFGANAAIITIDNTANLNTRSKDIASPAPTASASWGIGDISDPATVSGIDIQNSVSSDVTSEAEVTWTFNPKVPVSPVAGTITLNDLATTATVTGLTSYSYVFNMIAGVVYDMNFKGTMDNTSYVTLSVSSVPVPAALWLFAPALMGLMGLRRKSSKGLVVA